MGYESFYVEHLNVSVVPTPNTKINKNKAKYLILLLLNTGDEEFIIQKSCTITLGGKSRWKIRQSMLTAHSNNAPTIQLQVNKLTSQKPDESMSKQSVRQTP